jgi:dynactin complex subunit
MKVDINVPESLNEITLYQYQKFEKLIQDNEASHFVNQKTIEIFCNIELKDVARIRIADIDDLLAHLNNLLQAKPKLTRTFKLGVYEFGFIPKLEDMTSGEFIDLENYLSNTETLHQAMAVLYRPITSKVKDLYTIEEYESSYKYSEVLKYMPLDIALGSMLFFWTLHNDCVSGLMDFIQNEVEQSEQVKQLLEKNMDGINLFMPQHRETFLDLMRLPNFQ